MTYALLGRDDEEKSEAAEMIRIKPGSSLTNDAEGSLYKNPVDEECFYGALRKVGLPE